MNIKSVDIQNQMIGKYEMGAVHASTWKEQEIRLMSLEFEPWMKQVISLLLFRSSPYKKLQKQSMIHNI
jgi:hypothetical protein